MTPREQYAFRLFQKGAPLEVLAHCLGCTIDDAEVWTADPIGFAGTFSGRIPADAATVSRRWPAR